MFGDSIALARPVVNPQVGTVRPSGLGRQVGLFFNARLPLPGIGAQRCDYHREKIRPGGPDPPNKPARLINKRPGYRVVFFIRKRYNISVHNPPDNLANGPPWPPDFITSNSQYLRLVYVRVAMVSCQPFSGRFRHIFPAPHPPNPRRGARQ